MKLVNCEKAVSEVVGKILIFSIVFLGISIITINTLPNIYTMENINIIRNIEQSFTILDTRASKVALGSSPIQVVEMELSGGYISVVPNSSSDKSYISFDIKNGANITRISIPMGKIVYSLNDRNVAYEGGGIWSKYDDTSIMISPPEFNYNGVTLTLPVINISGSYSIGGKDKIAFKIEKNGNKIIYPTDVYNNPTPIESIINITVYSEYYDGWADYFRNVNFAKIEEIKDEKKVVVTLEGPPLITNLSYGILASEEIELENTAEIDSYNSSIGNYTISRSGNGSIRANNEIELENKATINGSALSGDVLEAGHGCNGGKCRILGDAYGYVSYGSLNIEGNLYPPVEKISLKSTNDIVNGKINDYKIHNNNTNSSCLSGTNKTELLSSVWSGDCTIYSGNYYLTKFEFIDNKNLIFDTSNGDINIAVDIPSDDIRWEKGVISVIGNHNVKIYADSGINVGRGVQINRNINDKSSNFQVYSASVREIRFQQGNTLFCGFVYAPYSKIYVQQSAQIFGALVGERFEVDNSQEVHFDQALMNFNPELGEGIALVYLYVNSDNVKVSNV